MAPWCRCLRFCLRGGIPTRSITGCSGMAGEYLLYGHAWTLVWNNYYLLSLFMCSFEYQFVTTCWAPRTPPPHHNHCLAEELWGNGSQWSVVCANATANTVGELLLPLLRWLDSPYGAEQPDQSSVFSLAGFVETHHMWATPAANQSLLISANERLSYVVPKENSLWWDWPSVAPHFTLCERIHVKMLAFGALTPKPLSLRGTWKGLPILRTGVVGIFFHAPVSWMLLTGFAWEVLILCFTGLSRVIVVTPKGITSKTKWKL